MIDTAEMLLRVSELDGEVRARFYPRISAIGIPFLPTDIDKERWKGDFNQGINLETIVRDLDFIHEMIHYIQNVTTTFGLERALLLSDMLDDLAGEAPWTHLDKRFFSKKGRSQQYTEYINFYDQETRVIEESFHIKCSFQYKENGRPTNTIYFMRSEAEIPKSGFSPSNICREKEYYANNHKLFSNSIIDTLNSKIDIENFEMYELNTASIMEGYAVGVEFIYLASLLHNKVFDTNLNNFILDRLASLPPQYRLTIEFCIFGAEYSPHDAVWVHNALTDIAMMYSPRMLREVGLEELIGDDGDFRRPIDTFMAACEKALTIRYEGDTEGEVSVENLRIFQDRICVELGIPSIKYLSEINLAFMRSKNINEQTLKESLTDVDKFNSFNPIWPVAASFLGHLFRDRVHDPFFYHSSMLNLIKLMYEEHDGILTVFNPNDKIPWRRENFLYLNTVLLPKMLADTARTGHYPICPLKQGNPFYCQGRDLPDKHVCTYGSHDKPEKMLWCPAARIRSGLNKPEI